MFHYHRKCYPSARIVHKPKQTKQIKGIRQYNVLEPCQTVSVQQNRMRPFLRHGDTDALRHKH